MDREGQVCPTCGQPVGTVVKRHKTLGAWVPLWQPGPCHNPNCPNHPETDPETEPEGPAPGPETGPESPAAASEAEPGSPETGPASPEAAPGGDVGSAAQQGVEHGAARKTAERKRRGTATDNR